MASVPQPKKKTLLFSAKSPGPTNYFDPDSYSFLENKLVMQLIDRFNYLKRNRINEFKSFIDRGG